MGAPTSERNERVLIALPAKALSWPALDATAKRFMDLLLSGLALLVALPIFVVVAAAIVLDSNGPALYPDKRLGKHGRLFTCYKFRTMYSNGNAILDQYLDSHPEALAEWKKFKKLRSYDPRVTRIGRLLRALSLDELPQLWNVIRGEMSLVGPRPYLPREYEEMGSFRESILSVAPGITGLWQVSGRNELSFRQRLRLEAWYARHRSVGLDVQLLLRTVGVVLVRRGAY